MFKEAFSISTKQEVMIENKLCKIRRIKINIFEKVETTQGKYKIVVRMYPFKENRSKIFIDDSELTRIIKHLNPIDNCPFADVFCFGVGIYPATQYFINSHK